jgi:hypothetical protein
VRASGVSLALLLVLGACGDDERVRIDGRSDSGGREDDTGPDPRDADPSGEDAGTPPGDGGGSDAGMPPADSGCADPPAPTPWMPVDTGGPAGETVSACLARVGSRTDDRLPDEQRYDLTTFGGPGDEQPVACSGAADADGTWFYAANSQRFACGQRARLVDPARSRCVIVEVADLGPNACVEEAGGMPIWDVSPLAAQELFMVSSVGWSEHRAVFGAPVDSGNPLGPCDHLEDPSGINRQWIGGACTGAADCPFAGGACLGAADGWPGGHCTQTCTTNCPDRDGATAYTACADLDDGTTRCVARCDYTLYANGCRDGYGCFDSAHPTTGNNRRVCLPLMCGT